MHYVISSHSSSWRTKLTVLFENNFGLLVGVILAGLDCYKGKSGILYID